MRTLIVSPDARVAAVAILNFTEDKYDAATADRYRALIQQAYLDLLTAPDRAGVKTDPAIPADINLYAIRHSRRRLPPYRRPATARHVVAFRYDDRSSTCFTTAWICPHGCGERIGKAETFRKDFWAMVSGAYR